MNCTNCRKELPENARFCDSCGMQVVAPVAENPDIPEPVLESPVELPAPELTMDTMPLPVITMSDIAPAYPEEKPAPPALQTAPPPPPEPVQPAPPPPAPAYTPPSYTPPVYTPPVYTPPVYTQQPGTGAPPHEQFQSRKGWGPILTLGQSVGFVIVMMLPLVNFIMLCVWGFGGHRNPSRQNLSRAILIVSLIMMTLTIIGVIAMAIVFSSYGYRIPWDFYQYGSYYGFTR